MPIYEYSCKEHGMFEVRQPMFSDKVADCPVCGKPAEHRISKCASRFAQTLTVYDHTGKVLDSKPDAGISPPVGQPYPMV